MCSFIPGGREGVREAASERQLHQCHHRRASGDQLDMRSGRGSASGVSCAGCKVQRSDEKIPSQPDQEAAAADKIPAVT